MGVEPTWDAKHPTDGFEDRGVHRDSCTPETYPQADEPMGKEIQYYHIPLSFFCQLLNGAIPPIASQWREVEKATYNPNKSIGISM
jgi:hypothetical protein